ncbi:UNVERIFIED_CONTAM: hypothetical protein PYX00_005875 [Menopon gallinae]|uniref:G-protein coupled receptors family 1 profile domain-containing protein n=1 Tax=Menopon gallinae TaxID=328185 RepID=A0AAW2HT59_9NEOP
MEDQQEDSDNLFLIFCNLLLGGIFLSAFIANVLVLVVFYRKSGLRSIANRFVVNLMIINILSCISLLPLSLADNSLTSSDKALCIATELSSVFCSSVIIYAVLLIALDQYCAVVDPLHYHRVISSTKSNLMIISSWCLSALFTVLDGVQPSIDEGEYSVFRHCGLRSDTSPRNETSDATPEAPASKMRVYRYVFCTIFAVSVFVIPFVLICFIYYRICAAACGNTKRTRAGCLGAEESCAGKPESNYFVIVNDETKRENAEQMETSGLLAKEMERPPSFVVTRPSPPKSVPDDAKDELKVPTPLLKPTLKNNPSFSKLSSLHIQFSSETKELQLSGGSRRHSIPEVENLTKPRSPSIHSNTFEVSRATPSRSSRSSSINSSSMRHPASRASSIRSTSSYIVSNIRHRISNASLFRYREEARAARISALVIVMALVCWLPFFTVFYLHSGIQLEVDSGRRTFPLYLDSFSIAFLLLSAVVSPFLFAFRNRKIKKEIRKIMGFRGRDLRSKSFYKYNLSMDMKSQKTQVLLGMNKKPDYQMGTATY